MTKPTELSVQEVARILVEDPSVRLMDVREDFELRMASLPQAEHLTGEVADRMLAEGNKEARYIFMCHHGVRSLSAAYFFAQNGFTNVASMAGGIDAWSVEIDPRIPRY